MIIPFRIRISTPATQQQLQYCWGTMLLNALWNGMTVSKVMPYPCRQISETANWKWEEKERNRAWMTEREGKGKWVDDNRQQHIQKKCICTWNNVDVSTKLFAMDRKHNNANTYYLWLIWSLFVFAHLDAPTTIHKTTLCCLGIYRRRHVHSHEGPDTIQIDRAVVLCM